MIPLYSQLHRTLWKTRSVYQTGGGEVQPSSSLVSIDFTLLVTFWRLCFALALNALSTISNQYWWHSVGWIFNPLHPASRCWWESLLHSVECARSHLQPPEINLFARLTPEPVGTNVRLYQAFINMMKHHGGLWVTHACSWLTLFKMVQNKT